MIDTEAFLALTLEVKELNERMDKLQLFFEEFIMMMAENENAN